MPLSTAGGWGRPRTPAIWTLGLATGALAACTVPNFEGPQLQSPPRGFLLAENSYALRELVSGHDPVFHVAWVESGVDASTIYIDGYRAVLGYEDAVAAREGARRAAIDPDAKFGEVEPLTVDGRDGWGWAERIESPTRGLLWVAYRALVPYDSVTYTLEFDSGNPTFKATAPDTLKAVILTFAIGRTTYNIPLIALLIGAAVAAVTFLRSKRQERTARVRAINLVKVPKKQASAEGEAAKRPPPQSTPRPPVPPTRGPPTTS